MAKYDAVLFDADETLFDYVRSAKEALAATLARHHLPAPPNVWELYKTRNDQGWRQFEQGECSKEQLQINRFVLLFADLEADGDPVGFNRDYLDALSRGGYLLPGAEALCVRLFPHLPLYIVTNGMAQTQKGRLAASPLKQYIRKMYVSEEVGAQKPRREYFDAVVSDLGITDRSRLILLGDSLTSDMAGGIGAGIPVCWYNPGGKDPGGLAIDFEIRELSAFPDLVL